MTTTVNQIKCNHLLCIGRSPWNKGVASVLVSFAGDSVLPSRETYCCPRCFAAAAPVIAMSPSDYTVTEL